MKTKITITLLAVVAAFTLSFVSISNSGEPKAVLQKQEVRQQGEPVGGFASADKL